MLNHGDDDLERWCAGERVDCDGYERMHVGTDDRADFADGDGRGVDGYATDGNGCDADAGDVWRSDEHGDNGTDVCVGLLEWGLRGMGRAR